MSDTKLWGIRDLESLNWDNFFFMSWLVLWSTLFFFSLCFSRAGRLTVWVLFKLERIFYTFLRKSWVRFSEHRRNFLFIISFRLILLYLNASHLNMFQWKEQMKVVKLYSDNFYGKKKKLLCVVCILNSMKILKSRAKKGSKCHRNLL